MKKVISALAVSVLCLSSAARADRSHNSGSRGFLKEHSLRLGVDTELGVPLGNYSDVNSVGAGVMVSSELAITDALAGTARLGFQAHMDRSVGIASSHVNAIPFLLGTKYYLSSERQGMFAGFELGMFELISSTQRGTVSNTVGDLKFGMGVGVGIQQSQWSARMSMHTQDLGNFGNAMVITGGIGYQFGTL
jgi:hypothetical protein